MQNPEKVQNCADALIDALGGASSPHARPLVGLVLGTGLGGVADKLVDARSVSFATLPFFPPAGVNSHAGRFVSGFFHGIPVIVQQGRCHLYEGYSPFEVCLGTRSMAKLGIKALVLTNAAGALNPRYDAGALMLLADHINATGMSPLTGFNCDEWGPRFPDMSAVYDAEFQTLALDEALKNGIRLEKGVYLSTPGPQLETPAETRAFRLMGADAVGMSTVLEAIAARHMGLRILGFSICSNKNLPDCMAETSLEEIIAMAQKGGETLSRLLGGLIPRLASTLAR